MSEEGGSPKPEGHVEFRKAEEDTGASVSGNSGIEAKVFRWAKLGLHHQCLSLEPTSGTISALSACHMGSVALWFTAIWMVLSTT